MEDPEELEPLEDEPYFEDEDDEEEEPGSGSADSDVDGAANPPRFAPMYTGLLDASGRPILKHPVVMRTGFWPEEKKYYCPTKENAEDGAVVGWFYESM